MLRNNLLPQTHLFFFDQAPAKFHLWLCAPTPGISELRFSSQLPYPFVLETKPPETGQPNPSELWQHRGLPSESGVAPQ